MSVPSAFTVAARSARRRSARPHLTPQGRSRMSVQQALNGFLHRSLRDFCTSYRNQLSDVCLEYGRCGFNRCVGSRGYNSTDPPALSRSAVDIKDIMRWAVVIRWLREVHGRA
jgi:hypothetical protein